MGSQLVATCGEKDLGRPAHILQDVLQEQYLRYSMMASEAKSSYASQAESVDA